MIVIPPLTLTATPPISMTSPWSITPAMLTSTTAAEPGTGEAVWVSGTAYTVGTQVIRLGNHRKYECIVAVTSATPPESDSTKWINVGASNAWAMFDIYRNLSTTATTSLVVAIAPGTRINSIGLVGAQTSSVLITMTIGATVYYTKTTSMLLRNTQNATDYCFGAFRYQPNLLLLDLPLVSGATITITYTGSTINSGRVVLNKFVDLGNVTYGASNDGLNFSKIDRDTFGNANLLAKRTIAKTDQKLAIKKGQVDALLQLRIDLNAVPALWSGLDDLTTDGYFKALLILGIYRQFQIPLEHFDDTTVSLQLEEI